MELEEKYEVHKGLFLSGFVHVGEPTGQWMNVLLSSVNLDALSGTMGGGASDWCFAYGFKKAYEAFGGNVTSPVTFMYLYNGGWHSRSNEQLRDR